MKWLVLALVMLACDKPDTAAVYREQAVALETYYRPIVDAFTRRIDKIRARGQTLREPVPGADQTGNLFKAAGQTLGELTALVGAGPDGKSALDKRIAATTDPDALAAVVAAARTKLEAGAVSITTELNAVETWVGQAELELKVDRPATPR